MEETKDAIKAQMIALKSEFEAKLRKMPAKRFNDNVAYWLKKD